MPVISKFGGIFPRVAEHLLPAEAAVVAHNVKLRNGMIEAWRERKDAGFAVQDAVSFFSMGCCTLSWDTCVTATAYLPDYDRIFLTGRTDYPEHARMTNCAPEYFALGVPDPQTPPVVSAVETTGRDTAQRTYFYTYVNVFGEESAPSPPSLPLTVADKTAVNISGLVVPPVGYGITSIRIYRSATALRTGHEKEQEASTVYLEVAEIPANAGGFTDTVWEMFLGSANNTREVRMPPAALRQIRWVRPTGVLTGVTDNQVHFSANFQPYNWPAEYDLTLPYNIQHIVTVDQYAIVSTDGYPYVISAAPSCEARKCRGVSEGDVPLPDIGCGYANSAIATPFGMIYSSKDGLVLVSPDAKFQVITSQWFSTDEWRKVRPETVRMAYWRGYLFIVTDIISFLLEIDGKTYMDFELGSLTTLSDRPVDLLVTDSGELLLLEERFIYQWEAGNSYREYQWESREYDFNGESSPTSAKVRSRNTEFTITNTKLLTSYSRKIFSEQPFRLGRLGRSYNFRIGFHGIGAVEYAEVGMMNTTLGAGK